MECRGPIDLDPYMEVGGVGTNRLSGSGWSVGTNRLRPLYGSGWSVGDQ